MDNYERQITAKIDRVYKQHPELVDHRVDFPWLHGWLGDPTASVWFVAENPSATQVRRVHSDKATVESQWAVSKGDLLFRETIFELGLKRGSPLSPGGWNCYITDAMKSEVFVADWHGRKSKEKEIVAEMWAPVLSLELELGRPQRLVVLGGNAARVLRHLSRRQLIPTLPMFQQVHHYSYLYSYPDRRGRPQGDPTRIKEWKRAVATAVLGR